VQLLGTVGRGWTSAPTRRVTSRSCKALLDAPSASAASTAATSTRPGMSNGGFSRVSSAARSPTASPPSHRSPARCARRDARRLVPVAVLAHLRPCRQPRAPTMMRAGGSWWAKTDGCGTGHDRDGCTAVRAVHRDVVVCEGPQAHTWPPGTTERIWRSSSPTRVRDRRPAAAKFVTPREEDAHGSSRRQARWNKMRRKKIARRLEMRTLRKGAAREGRRAAAGAPGLTPHVSHARLRGGPRRIEIASEGARAAASAASSRSWRSAVDRRDDRLLAREIAVESIATKNPRYGHSTAGGRPSATTSAWIPLAAHPCARSAR